MGSPLDPEAVERFTSRIASHVEAGLYDGAVVALARGGEVVLLEAIGRTDLAADRKASTDDVFLLMSMTKAMTAMLGLELIDRGQLQFDTPVADVIPEFGAKGKQRVTVYQLLNHTGGVWSYFAPTPGLKPEDMGNLAAMVAAVSNQPLDSLPGERVRYSPWAGYAIVAEVVRRLDPAGRRFRDIIAEDLFVPLGMHDTAMGLRPDLAARRVPVVLREDTEGTAEKRALESLNEILDAEAERPSGGVFSTASDVLAFSEMLRTGGQGPSGVRVLSPAIVDFALRNHTGERPNTFWDYAKEMRDIPEYPANLGLGVYVRGEGAHLTPLGLTASPGSFGAIGGGSTGFVVDPERDLTFVFLSAGFLEGLHHFQRMQQLADLAIACAI